VRFVSEALGTDVGWDNATQEVKVKLNDKTINLWIGKTEYAVNGTEKVMDTEATITEKSRTMVPVRFISEGLGYFVDWEEAAGQNIVNITSYDDYVGPDGPSLNDGSNVVVESRTLRWDDPDRPAAQVGDTFIDQEGKKWTVDEGFAGVLMAGKPVTLDIGLEIVGGDVVRDGALSDGKVGGKLGEPYIIWDNGEGHWKSEWESMRQNGMDKPNRDGTTNGEEVSYWIWDAPIEQWMFRPLP